MATETELRELLTAIGDQAPPPESVRQRLASPRPPRGRRRHRRQWVSIGAAVTAVAGVVAVAVVIRGDDSPSDTEAAGPGSTIDRAVYALPLDAYYASPAQERTLVQAQYALVRRCARAHGVTLPDVHLGPANTPATFLAVIANNVRPLTLHQARTIGYDMYPFARSAVDTALNRLTPAQRQVVQGPTVAVTVPPPSGRVRGNGGCFAEADRTLLRGATPVEAAGVSTISGQPGLNDDDATVINTYVAKARSAESTPEVEGAQKRWSACMAGHGYPGLRSTHDAIGGAGHGGGMHSESAKRQAVQDVRCKQSTGFVIVWITALRNAQNAIIADHRAELGQFKKRLATRLANAADALK